MSVEKWSHYTNSNISKRYTCPNDTTSKVWLVPIISTMGEIKVQHVAKYHHNLEHHTKLIDWK
jgi:hypothetical protein